MGLLSVNVGLDSPAPVGRNGCVTLPEHSASPLKMPCRVYFPIAEHILVCEEK